MKLYKEKANETPGPLVSMGTRRFQVDTGTPAGKTEFDIECFQSVESRSALVLEYNGMELKNFGEYSDFYAFGESVTSAFNDQDIARLKGLNADLGIKAILEFRLCLPSDEEWSYRRNGCQKIHYIPYNWHIMGDDIRHSDEKEFLIWQNGRIMPEADAFFTEIERSGLEDAAPDRTGVVFQDGISTTARDNFRIAMARLDMEPGVESGISEENAEVIAESRSEPDESPDI